MALVIGLVYKLRDAHEKGEVTSKFLICEAGF